MTKQEAILLDKNGDLWIDLDKESNCYGVFGTESGFCYSLSADKTDAKLKKELLHESFER